MSDDERLRGSHAEDAGIPSRADLAARARSSPDTLRDAIAPRHAWLDPIDLPASPGESLRCRGADWLRDVDDALAWHMRRCRTARRRARSRRASRH